MQGVFTAADFCLQFYGGYSFGVDNEHDVQGCAQVDFLGLIYEKGQEKEVVLVEAKPPWVMKMMGDLLPVHGIKLRLAPNQPLVPKIFNAVSLRCNMDFDGRCNCILGCSLSGSKEDGVAVPDMLQLLDHLPPCQK